MRTHHCLRPGPLGPSWETSSVGWRAGALSPGTGLGREGRLFSLLLSHFLPLTTQPMALGRREAVPGEPASLHSPGSSGTTAAKYLLTVLPNLTTGSESHPCRVRPLGCTSGSRPRPWGWFTSCVSLAQVRCMWLWGGSRGLGLSLTASGPRR